MNPQAPLEADGWAPAVAVVMAVRDEGRSIGGALDSVRAQDYPGLTEIVVADAMSTDGTREIVAAHAAADPRVRLVDNPARTTPVGLNAAIRASTAEVIVRVDGHSILPPGYIARSVQELARTGADNVGGIQAAEGKGLRQRAIARAMSIRMGVGNAKFHYGGKPGPVDTVYLGVFKRATLERVGMFDEDLTRNQDSELNYRIRAAGGTVWFTPDLRVRYEPRGSLRALWRQYWASGAWKLETFRRHPKAVRWRQLAPPLLVAGLAASAVLALLPLGPVRLLSLVVPALWLGALLLASLWQLVRHADPSAVLLPVVLGSMHLAWGLGFIFGRAGELATLVPNEPASDSLWQRLRKRVAEISAKREVLKRLIGEDLKVKYESSVLGYVWSVLEPLMLTAVYFFVFAFIVKIDIEDYPLFIVLGVLGWNWFSVTISAATRALTSNAGLITKVYVPREVFPLSTVGSKTVEYLLSLFVVFIFAAAMQRGPSRYALLFPVAVLMQLVLLTGLTLGLSALNTVLRDIERVIRPLLRVLFYLSPVLYPLSRFPSRVVDIVALNPMVGIMELYHASMFPEMFQGWAHVRTAAIGSVLAFVIGWSLFLKLESHVLKEL